MPADSRIDQLLSVWERRTERGEVLTVADLCADCPELAPEVERQLNALQSVDRALTSAATLKHDPLSNQTIREFGLVGRSASQLVQAPIPSIDGYEMLGVLGRGAMAIVYLARQTSLNRMVALKMLVGRHYGRDDLARLRGEALALAALQHPNIIQIYDVGEHEGQPYLALEFAEGGSLAESQARAPASPRVAAELVKSIAEAVQAAHKREIVHRDLKPGNVLLTGDGTPKIADFGLAKRLGVDSSRTTTGLIVGTPSYMAPEQARGDKSALGPAIDIYALGAILYELLTGRPPFLGANPIDTVEQVRSREPVPPHHLQPKVPRALETICLKCLEKEPARRYAGASGLAEDLRRFLADEPILAQSIGPVERLWRWCKRHPTGASLGAVTLAAALLIVGAGVWFTGRLEVELANTRAVERALHRTLTEQIANRLDSDLRQVASVPETFAAMLSQRTDWTEPQLDAALRELLGRHPDVFGMCVAFEPGELTGRDDFALYVYRGADGLRAKQLLLPTYSPPYREWPWYRVPKEEDASSWGEPYLGVGGDHTPMVTFSAPIRRDGRFAGVVSIDLALAFFERLHKNLDAMDQTSHETRFLLSRNGTFLHHHDPAHQFPAGTSSLKDVANDPSFRTLAKDMAAGPSGAVESFDAATGMPATFLFARVPSSGWTVVVEATSLGKEQSDARHGK
jgi:tRNA A-37 threonylcarbamoyl transferase component Bud32